MDKHLGETGKGDGRVKMFLRTYLPLCVFFNSNKHLGGYCNIKKKKMTNRCEESPTKASRMLFNRFKYV